MENLAEYYYNKLVNTKTPGKELALFISSFFQDANYSIALLKQMNRLIKAYGRFDVYWAILSMAEVHNVDFTNSIYPLLSTIILNKRKRTYKVGGTLESKDRTRDVTLIRKQILKFSNRDISMEYPFDDK